MVEKEEWQCPVCGIIVLDESAPSVCAECNAPGALFRNVTHDQRDEVDPKAVEHFKRKVIRCWNYKIEPGTNRKNYHNLKLETTIDRRKVLEDNLEKSYVTEISRCAVCKMVYATHRIPAQRTDILEKAGIELKVNA